MESAIFRTIKGELWFIGGFRIQQRTLKGRCCSKDKKGRGKICRHQHTSTLVSLKGSASNKIMIINIIYGVFILQNLPARKIPWRKKSLPTSVFLPGEFHGQRSLAGPSPWARKESD